MDEVQHRPNLFPEIRGLIDDGKRRGLKNGRFLFLGSASYELLKQSGESLAGRIAFLELTPFRVDEIHPEQIDRLWLRGGFPDSFLAPDTILSGEWRRNFIDTYLTRDLSLHGKAEPLPAMRDLLRMAAHLLVIEQIIALMPDWEPYFYRTSNGAELDLLMLKGERLVAYEIKVSVAPKLSKGFYTARADIQPEQIFLVSRNKETWKTTDEIVYTNMQDLPSLIPGRSKNEKTPTSNG